MHNDGQCSPLCFQDALTDAEMFFFGAHPARAALSVRNAATVAADIELHEVFRKPAVESPMAKEENRKHVQ